MVFCTAVCVNYCRYRTDEVEVTWRDWVFFWQTVIWSRRMLQTVATNEVLQLHLSVCCEPEIVSQIWPLLGKSVMIMSCQHCLTRVPETDRVWRCLSNVGQYLKRVHGKTCCRPKTQNIRRDTMEYHIEIWIVRLNVSWMKGICMYCFIDSSRTWFRS